MWEDASAILRESRVWIVVGYSFPDSDLAVRELLPRSYVVGTQFHVFDPDESVSV